MSEQKRYRYPGPEYFRSKDQDIFFGRAKDIENLYKQVLLYNTLVLHADSGIGKSSLIEAGLIPAIEKKHPGIYRIISYRLENYYDLDFSNNEEIENPYLIIQTLQRITDPISHEVVNSSVHHTKNNNTLGKIYFKNFQDSLWITAKKLASIGKKLIIIFDQFEEIQSYPENYIRPFKKSLAELFANDIPMPYYEAVKRLKNQINLEDNISQSERTDLYRELEILTGKLEVKLIFVVREDKLGVMSAFSDYFPNILKNDFVLKPLRPEDAKEAITEPAMSKGDFECDRFLFTDTAVDKIINDLTEEREQPIETFQLQLICREVEKRIINNKLEKIVEDKHLLDIKEIIKKYYDDLIAELKLTKDQELKLRKILEEVFILPDQKRRKLVLSDEIIEIDEIINKLIENRLIRSVEHHEKTYYELSHDNLIEPILTNYNDRQEKKTKAKLRKQSIFLFIAILLAVIFIAATVTSGIMLKRTRQAKREIEQKNIEIDSARTMAVRNYQNAVVAVEKQKEAEVKFLVQLARQFEALQFYAIANRHVEKALAIDSTNRDAILLHEKYIRILTNRP